jgi:hypothetical protein
MKVFAFMASTYAGYMEVARALSMLREELLPSEELASSIRNASPEEVFFSFPLYFLY